jgi:2-polyprenyl-3-methyl-5-hydroxy-6-metoxy-1,4-benzoquinol methylase
MLSKEQLVEFSNRRSHQCHFTSYDDYVNSQVIYGLSHESENSHWKSGQIRCVNDKLSDFNRDISILDVCCGDGVGLLRMKELGFTNVVGVELSDKKIERARISTGLNVVQKDICSGPFDFDQEFDVIYSSHTIEHVLNPEYTLSQLKKFLKKDGTMFLVLPYPDVAASSPHNVHPYKVHCGVIPLGLHVKDNGVTTRSIIEKMGFRVIHCEFFDYREPEIHLTLKNV